MLAKLSVLGLYQYDPTIFDPLTMPGDLDKASFIALIMQECAELPTVYPNPDAFKFMLTHWAKRHGPIWDRLFESMTLEYNPLDNYDRYEEYTDTRTGNESASSENNTTANGSSLATAAATGFNSGEMQNTNQQNSTNAATNNAESSGTSEHAETIVHSAHLRGNIGVTTAMQLINEQRAVVRFNLYNEMLSDFMDAFCVCVY